jgi:hypothetical protein
MPEKPVEVQSHSKVYLSHPQWHRIQRIEFYTSSHGFSQITPEKSILFPACETGNFGVITPKETPDSSRTEIRTILYRRLDSRCKEGTLSYRTHIPHISGSYPLQVQIFIESPEGQEEMEALTGFFDVSGGKPAYVNCSMIRRNFPQLTCSALDRWGNPSPYPVNIKGRLSSEKESLDLNFKETLFHSLDENTPEFTRFDYEFNGENLHSNALPPKSNPIYFGDIHTHSQFSDAIAPKYPHELLDYAWRISALDFAAVTDHSEGIYGDPPSHQQVLFIADSVKSWDKLPGFTAFFGFEWTSSFHDPSSTQGHRTVIFPDFEDRWVRSDQPSGKTPELLYKNSGDCVSFIHHPMMRWGSFDWNNPIYPEQEKGVEIYSTHGRSIFPSDGGDSKGASILSIKKNNPLKFFASSDSHAGHPGLNNWKGVTPGLLDGGGLMAIFAPSNTKENLYKAMQEQNFYGTSGTRILIYPRITKDSAEFRVFGTAPLSSAEIHLFEKNGSHTVRITTLQGLNAMVQQTISPQTKAFFAIFHQEDKEFAVIGPFQTEN